MKTEEGSGVFLNMAEKENAEDRAKKGIKQDTDEIIAKEEAKKAAAERMYYVAMTDSFMSDWGEAEGRINKLVFVCQGYKEAQIVEDNAQNRTDMKYINICANKPYYNKRDYHTQYKTKEEYESWYVKNYFRDRKALE